MMGRVYLIWRYVVHASRWNNEQSRQIRSKLRCPQEDGFWLKAELEQRPYSMMLILIVGTTILFGIVLRNAEVSSIAISKQNYLSYSNALWCIIISMTCVGYGDFYPVTPIGRFIGISKSKN